MSAARQPTIISSRVLLRPFGEDDIEIVTVLAGHKDIAATTLRIPHPYESHHARTWIDTTRDVWSDGTGAVFAIVARKSDELVGSVGIEINAAHDNAEVGYWIGHPYWNHGYATAAAAAALRFAFDRFGVHRVHAHHFKRNGASGRVLERIGMRPEGELREHIRKDDRYEDIVLYGVLRRDYAPTSTTYTVTETTETQP